MKKRSEKKDAKTREEKAAYEKPEVKKEGTLKDLTANGTI